MKKSRIIFIASTIVVATVLGSNLGTVWNSDAPFTIDVVESNSQNGRATLVLRNRSFSIATYQGWGLFVYGTSASYSIQTLSDSGWEDRPLVRFCGNGRGTRVLFPGQSMTFPASVRVPQGRVALKLKSGLVAGRIVEVYSPAIEYTGI